MNLDHANGEFHNMFHVMSGILRVPRMHAATRNKSLRILLHVVSDKLIDIRRESDHFWRHVVDKNSPFHADLIQMVKELLRRAAKFNDVIEIRTLLFHGGKSCWLEHLDRLNVNVAVGDHRESGYMLEMPDMY